MLKIRVLPENESIWVSLHEQENFDAQFGHLLRQMPGMLTIPMNAGTTPDTARVLTTEDESEPCPRIRSTQVIQQHCNTLPRGLIL
jgi:hypothetical protein